MGAQDCIPEDYRAAGVLFFTRRVECGKIAQVLLGVENRKVKLKDIGEDLAGSAPRHVLLFPQGKREAWDKDFVSTARREFEEETGDPTGLATRLEAPVLEHRIWYEPAKMAVVLCEVSAQDVKSAAQLDARPRKGRS